MTHTWVFLKSNSTQIQQESTLRSSKGKALRAGALHLGKDQSKLGLRAQDLSEVRKIVRDDLHLAIKPRPVPKMGSAVFQIQQLLSKGFSTDSQGNSYYLLPEDYLEFHPRNVLFHLFERFTSPTRLYIQWRSYGRITHNFYSLDSEAIIGSNSELLDSFFHAITTTAYDSDQTEVLNEDGLPNQFVYLKVIGERDAKGLTVRHTWRSADFDITRLDINTGLPLGLSRFPLGQNPGYTWSGPRYL